MFTIPTIFGFAHAHVTCLHSRGTGHPICDLSRIIATRQLDALTVPSTHYVSNNCIYFQSHLVQTQLQSIKWPWKTDFFLSIVRNQQFAISSRWLLWSVWWLRNDISIPRAPENMSHKNIITIYFHIWTLCNPIIGIFRACRGISIKIFIYGRSCGRRHLISPARQGCTAQSEMWHLLVW